MRTHSAFLFALGLSLPFLTLLALEPLALAQESSVVGGSEGSLPSSHQTALSCPIDIPIH